MTCTFRWSDGCTALISSQCEYYYLPAAFGSNRRLSIVSSVENVDCLSVSASLAAISTIVGCRCLAKAFVAHWQHHTGAGRHPRWVAHRLTSLGAPAAERRGPVCAPHQFTITAIALTCHWWWHNYGNIQLHRHSGRACKQERTVV